MRPMMRPPRPGASTIQRLGLRPASDRFAVLNVCNQTRFVTSAIMCRRSQAEAAPPLPTRSAIATRTSTRLSVVKSPSLGATSGERDIFVRVRNKIEITESARYGLSTGHVNISLYDRKQRGQGMVKATKKTRKSAQLRISAQKRISALPRSVAIKDKDYLVLASFRRS